MTSEDKITDYQFAIRNLAKLKQDNYVLHFRGEFADKAVDLAIEAINKQIPKKVVFIPLDDDDDEDFKLPYCPNCGHIQCDHIREEDIHNCCNCGQSLIWEREETE